MKKDRHAYWREYARKHSKTPTSPSLGYLGEEIGLKVLVGSKRIYRPSDLEWKGKTVEVKTAIKQHGHFIQWTTKKNTPSKTFRWKFFLKQKGLVDLFLFICEDKEKCVEHIFLIPDKDIKTKYLSISENSIPTKFLQYRLTLA